MGHSTVDGIWDKIEVYCGYHADSGKQMRLIQNTQKIVAPFYVCGTQEEDHCPNRVNIDDYVEIVEKIGAMIAEDPNIDLTNMKFKHKGRVHRLEVKVLKHSASKIKIAVTNLTLQGGH